MLASLFPRAHARYTALPIMGGSLEGLCVWLHARGYPPGAIQRRMGAAASLVRTLRRRRVRSLGELTASALCSYAPPPDRLARHERVIGAGPGHHRQPRVGPQLPFGPKAPGRRHRGQEQRNAHRPMERDRPQHGPRRIPPGLRDHRGLRLGAQRPEHLECGEGLGPEPDPALGELREPVRACRPRPGSGRCG